MESVLLKARLRLLIFSIKIAPPPSQFKNLKPKKFSLLFLSHNCYISNMDNCVCIHVYNVRIMIWQYQNLFHINRRHIWLAHNQYNVFTASTTRWPIDDWGTSERLLTCFTNPSKLWLCNHLILHTVCVSLDHKSDHIMTNWPTYQHFTENFNALALSIFYNLSADHHVIFNNMQFVFSSQSDLSTGRWDWASRRSR